jgi:hypothetical protein
MLKWLLVALIAAFALYAGTFVARKSAAKKPIHGGPLATAFHYLGVTIGVAISPTLLVAAFVFRLPFIQYSGVCIGLFALEFVMLMLYAYFELQTPGNVPPQKS